MLCENRSLEEISLCEFVRLCEHRSSREERMEGRRHSPRNERTRSCPVLFCAAYLSVPPTQAEGSRGRLWAVDPINWM